MSTCNNPKETPAKPSVGAPCWIEIMASEPQTLKEFYAALFPAWKFRTAKAETGEVVHITFEQPSGLTGGIVRIPEGHPKPDPQPMCIGSTVYYYVDSIDEIENMIEEQGGIKVLDKKQESDHGWYANFKDPDGNRFGVYEANWGAGNKEDAEAA